MTGAGEPVCKCGAQRRDLSALSASKRFLRFARTSS
jgi:hypothetical protein